MFVFGVVRYDLRCGLIALLLHFLCKRTPPGKDAQTRFRVWFARFAIVWQGSLQHKNPVSHLHGDACTPNRNRWFEKNMPKALFRFTKSPTAGKEGAHQPDETHLKRDVL